MEGVVSLVCLGLQLERKDDCAHVLFSTQRFNGLLN
jgi:hypothetical protein